jgi:hypothetical protein
MPKNDSKYFNNLIVWENWILWHFIFSLWKIPLPCSSDTLYSKTFWLTYFKFDGCIVQLLSEVSLKSVKKMTKYKFCFSTVKQWCFRFWMPRHLTCASCTFQGSHIRFFKAVLARVYAKYGINSPSNDGPLPGVSKMRNWYLVFICFAFDFEANTWNWKKLVS